MTTFDNASKIVAEQNRICVTRHANMHGSMIAARKA